MDGGRVDGRRRGLAPSQNVGGAAPPFLFRKVKNLTLAKIGG